jgi:hypothetical protein
MTPFKVTKARLEKNSISMEIFIPIVSMVFLFWLTYWWIKYWMNKLADWQNNILASIQEIKNTNEQQLKQMKDNLKTATTDHKNIDSKLWYLMPNMRLLSMKFWLPLYAWN